MDQRLSAKIFPTTDWVLANHTDIEKRRGLLRCYLSRVENGHTVPAIETLEKMARALKVHP